MKRNDQVTEGKRKKETENRPLSPFWGIAAAVVVLDRVSKMLAPRISPEGVPLIPGVIGLRYAENTGAAFSLLSGQPWILGIVSLVIIAGAFLALRGKKIRPLARTGLMMMLGGAVGNMIDRFFAGFVTDMIEFLFVRFAVFNVADVFLCVGCGLTALALLLPEREKAGETAGGTE